MIFPIHDAAIIRIPELETTKCSHEVFVNSFDSFWQGIFNSLSLQGSLWVFSSNKFINGELVPLTWELTDKIKTVTKFKLKNILVVYHEERNAHHLFANSYYNISFFVKSLNSYYFDKDAIREPHIFKDIEWGKRKVGKSGYNEREGIRYSPRGRDSGNVFYKTERNSEGKILRVYECSIDEMYEKIVKVSTKKDSVVMSNITDPDFSGVIGRLERKLVQVGV
jgi:hypothetical protein